MWRRELCVCVCENTCEVTYDRIGRVGAGGTALFLTQICDPESESEGCTEERQRFQNDKAGARTCANLSGGMPQQVCDC